MNYVPFIEPAADLVLVTLLVFYRTRRRFGKERVNGLWAFLDGNIVEIIIGAVLIPDGLVLLASLAGKLS